MLFSTWPGTYWPELSFNMSGNKGNQRLFGAISKKSLAMVISICLAGAIYFLSRNSIPSVADKSLPLPDPSHRSDRAAFNMETATSSGMSKPPYAVQDFVRQLTQRQQRLRKKLSNTDLVEQIALNREIDLIQIKIDDADNAFQQHFHLLQEIKSVMQDFRSFIEEDDFRRSRDELEFGNTTSAYDTLAKISLLFIKKNSELTLQDAALIKYSMGRIAEDKNEFQKAYRFYKQAVQYQPENISYFIALGTIANQIALYGNAIQYLEAALAMRRAQKSLTAADADLANIFLNLAGAYEGRGYNDKARQYYRLAFGVLKQNSAVSPALLQSLQEKVARGGK